MTAEIMSGREVMVSRNRDDVDLYAIARAIMVPSVVAMIEAVIANLALTDSEFRVSFDNTCDQPEVDFQATAINGNSAKNPDVIAMLATAILCADPVGFCA
jgi:hypothetical protein